MDKFFNELLKRISALFLILGVILLLLAANGQLPLPGAKPFSEAWITAIACIGSILTLAGVVMAIIDWRTSNGHPAEPKTVKTSGESDSLLDSVSIQQLKHSGLTRAFRIPVDNNIRLVRVCDLIREEVDKGNGCLRLAASSGYSYINPNGPVWKSAGIGSLIENGEIKKLEVVLESPFTSFAETRALANNVVNHQGEEKQIMGHLVELLKYPNVDLRVTGESITCSLFLTSQAVYYDPYLWSLPEVLARTENNFWVLEFDKVTNPKLANMDCYGLLERHFEFLQKNSIALEKLLHHPEPGAKAPRKEQYCRLFEKNPELALNNYTTRTMEFHEHIKKRMKEK
jgi:hypothetical protein